ncbi:MAG: 50S ribosomal protein L10 [Saprospiraceae bacterium]|uniref:Large ribosomal subunit protein uL10 n=1 Tax=Candidatus Opimibacter skivensis TaxID=2982028 RepID=A0A9D7SW21_9BACT|nr:50S ribosomal protein L10 [Candidatus Opimibacter skivensis]
MKKQDKDVAIGVLREKFDNSTYIYFTDASAMTVEQVNKLRRMCFQKGIEMTVVKNKLARKAMESLGDERGFAPVYKALAGPTAIMLTDSANAPAKLIKEFRGKDGKRPILKAAYIDSDVIFGDENLDMLIALKSKNELIGDILMLLQSPAKNVISALKSSGSTIAGLVKTLQERQAQ